MAPSSQFCQGSGVWDHLFRSLGFRVDPKLQTLRLKPQSPKHGILKTWFDVCQGFRV